MRIILAATVLLFASSAAFAADNSVPAEKTFDAPHGLTVSVKMIGPYAEPADLQIICLFKHRPTGGSIQDLVIEAGPAFFDNAAKQVGEGIESITAVLAQRNAAPYGSARKQ